MAQAIHEDDVRRRAHHQRKTSPKNLYPDDVEPQEIEEDIEHTRAAMDDTISELFHRLAPRNLLGDGLAIVRAMIERKVGGKSRRRRRRPREYDEYEYGYEDESDHEGLAKRATKAAGRQVVEVIKNHPLPSALITAGVVWMIVEEDRPTRKARKQIKKIMKETSPLREPGVTGIGYTEGYIETDIGGETGMRGHEPGMTERMRHAGERIGEKAGEMRHRMGEKAGQMRERVGDAAETVKERVSHAGERVGDWAHRTRERLSDTGEYISERASDVGHRVRDRAADIGERVKHGYQRTRDAVEDYPLVVGAAALGVGLLAGLLLPRTRTEDEYLGEASEQFKERTREMGREVMERGTEVAEHTVAKAATEAGKEVMAGASERSRQHDPSQEPAEQHGERFGGTDV